MNTDNTSFQGDHRLRPAPSWTPTTRHRVLLRSTRWAARLCQPARIALWNLTRLAECLLPLFSDAQDKAIEDAQVILGEFPESSHAYQAGRGARSPVETRDGDDALVQDLLDAMAQLTPIHADIPKAERGRGRSANNGENRQCSLSRPLRRMGRALAAADFGRAALSGEARAAMRAVNPAHSAQPPDRVVIQAAVTGDDYARSRRFDRAGQAL